MNNNKKTNPYLEELLKLHPDIKSGRKNYSFHNKRIIKTLKIIKKHFKKSISNHT